MKPSRNAARLVYKDKMRRDYKEDAPRSAFGHGVVVLLLLCRHNSQPSNIYVDEDQVVPESNDLRY